MQGHIPLVVTLTLSTTLTVIDHNLNPTLSLQSNITLFQCLSGENWTDVMYGYMVPSPMRIRVRVRVGYMVPPPMP